MGLFKAKYHIYLYSVTWRKIRRRILERAKGVCEKCLLKPATHVHHLHYDNIYNEKDEDLIALCKPCHQKLHE